MRLLVSAAIVAAFLLPAQAHDIYTDWKRPDTGTSCCSSWDCYPTEAQFKGGTWFALRREDRKWIAVPDHLILKNEITQDGKRTSAPRGQRPATSFTASNPRSLVHETQRLCSLRMGFAD